MKRFCQKEGDTELFSSIVLVISDSQTAGPALKAVIMFIKIVSKWKVMAKFLCQYFINLFHFIGAHAGQGHHEESAELKSWSLKY